MLYFPLTSILDVFCFLGSEKNGSLKQGTSLVLSSQGWQGLKYPWSHGDLLMKQVNSVQGTLMHQGVHALKVTETLRGLGHAKDCVYCASHY